MYIKQKLLIILVLFLSLPLLSQMSFHKQDIFSPISVTGEEGDPVGGGKTMICNQMMPGIPVDSAIRYRIVSPEDSVKVSMQVFDQCSAQGKPLRSTLFRWNERGRRWVSAAKEDLFYTRDGNIRERQYYEWIDEYEVYSMMEEESFSYRKGHLEKYEYGSYDPVMIGRKILSHTEEYDEQGRLVCQQTRKRSEELGWYDVKVVRLDYDEENEQVSVTTRELRKAGSNPTYDMDYQVLALEGSDYSHLIQAVIVRPWEKGAEFEGSGPERVYYFYNTADLLADQSGQ